VILSAADRTYVEANYVTLDTLCSGRAQRIEEVEALIRERRLPAPSYVLEDGTGMFPADYFDLVDEAGGVDELRVHFAGRHRVAAIGEGVGAQACEQDWEAYLDGTYGVCLRRVTPETIVRKSSLVSSLCELLVLARPLDSEWRSALRTQVDELDGLEREFAPDYDRRGRFGRLPTRDLLIGAARERFPDIFAATSKPAEARTA
jgi:Family of unknown function (DUF6058)